MSKLYEDTPIYLKSRMTCWQKSSELTETLSSLQKEVLRPQFEIVSVKCETDENRHLGGFIFHTKDGKNNYSDAFVLADQVSPANISGNIKSVRKCFLPSLNTDGVQESS